MPIAIADHIVMVTMQLLERAWPWPKERLVDIRNYDPRVDERGRGDLFPVANEGS